MRSVQNFPTSRNLCHGSGMILIARPAVNARKAQFCSVSAKAMEIRNFRNVTPIGNAT